MTAKPHPYQHSQFDHAQTSPKGSFEARKMKNGLYIRVDMPGVPKDGVKVVKYNDSRTVNFSGKAPVLWPGYDSPNSRVYDGYVVLDRDPDGINFMTDVEDGVLRLFFPKCDGSLHFLSPLRTNSAAAGDDNRELGQDEEDHKIPAEANIAFILHSPLEPFGITLSGGKPEHINPYLLSGEKSVYTHKIIPIPGEDHLIYIRLDVPDTCHKCNFIFKNSDGGIVFGGMTYKNLSRFQDGPREYLGVLQPNCGCCMYRVINYDTTHGVIRFLVRKSDTADRSPMCHVSLPAPSPGGREQPSTVKIIGNMPRTLGSRPQGSFCNY